MIKIDVEKICDEISNKSFNIVNPKNTHEDIAVIKVLDVLNILSKCTNNKVVIFHEYTIEVPYPTFEEEYKKMVAYIESIHTENQKIKLAISADFDFLLIKIVCDGNIANNITNYILDNHYTATEELIFKEE